MTLWALGIAGAGLGLYLLVDALLDKKDPEIQKLLEQIQENLDANMGVITEPTINLIHQLAARLAEKEYAAIMAKQKEDRRKKGVTQPEFSQIVSAALVKGGGLCDDSIYKAIELASITKTKYQIALARVVEKNPDAQYQIIHILEKGIIDKLWSKDKLIMAEDAVEILQYLNVTWDALCSGSWARELLPVRKAKLFDMATEKFNMEMAGILSQEHLLSDMECLALIDRLKGKMKN